MSRLAPSTNLHGWRRIINAEEYFDAEIAAFQSTLDDIRDLPQTAHQESHA